MIFNGYYILDKHGEPMVETDSMRWSEWFKTADRKVNGTDVGAFFVSTVFLGMDHNFGDGEPILYETCIFKNNESKIELGDFHSEVVDRYTDKEKAEIGHDGYVKKLQEK